METKAFVLRRKDNPTNQGHVYLENTGWYSNNLDAAKKFTSHHEVFRFLNEWNKVCSANLMQFNGGDILEIVEVVGKHTKLEWTLA